MNKEIEICCNCKWWNRGNEINVKRLNNVGRNAPLCLAALCLYKEPPPIRNFNWEEKNIYTYFLYSCSKFVLVDGYNNTSQEKKGDASCMKVLRGNSLDDLECSECEESELDEVVEFVDDDDTTFWLCKDCLLKALKVLEEE